MKMKPLRELMYATSRRLVEMLRNIFHQVRASPVEIVHNIWLDMIHTLKGQWDCLIGDSEPKAAQCH